MTTTDPATSTRKYKILIVEDNLSVQEILSRQLTKAGYEVMIVDRSSKAVQWMSKNNPDLIILDVMLPEMDGYDLCRLIREKHPLGTLPIIMLSALGQEVQDRIRGLEAGANDFIAKPYHVDELRARIQMLLVSHNRRS